MQHGAYIYNQVSEVASSHSKSIKIVSTWGSDLVLFSKIASHEDQIRKVMGWTNILTAERAIEEEIAQGLDFNGDFLCPVYITIGMPSGSIESPINAPSKRNMIIIKGHLDFSGRAFNALQAISLVKSNLEAFKIRIFSANPAVALEVERMKSELKIDISTIPRIKKDELKEYFKESRVYLGISISDGLPGSMMEAMSSGCFPIQSKNSAASEFIQNGISGFIVDEWNINDIAAKLLIALTDDSLVDKAALINQGVLINEFNYIDGLRKIENLYKKALLL
jgi:glycosyltransferase involved in cell wall biosynthesis